MTNTKTEMLYQKMGYRLKQLAKEHRFTREDMSEAINYSCGHISRFYSGLLEIPDNAAQILSDLWNIRKEYILCEDDFKTDEEMYLYLNENAVKDMQAAIDYLKTLGLIIRPCTTLHCSLRKIYQYFSQLKKYIKKSEIERLQHKYDFELPQEEFTRNYFFENCSVELSSPLLDLPFVRTEEMTKTSDQDSIFFLYAGDVKNPLGENLEVSLAFKIFYHDKLIRSITVRGLQEFVKKLDAYSKCTIETILFNENLGNSFLGGISIL